MSDTFHDASHSYDSRSPIDKRVQPWRAWWPVVQRSNESGEDTENTKDSVLLSTDADAPWVKWRFNPEVPWEKPWIFWPLAWSPKYYGQAEIAPEVVHDQAFIEACLSLHSTSPAPISKYNPFRTTSTIQFFQDREGSEHEKPYACRVPVTSHSALQSNFHGKWQQIMLTDVRGHEDLFTLDKDGFEWFQHKTERTVADGDLDVLVYMKEMARVIKERYKGSDVYIFDYVKRSPDKTDRWTGYSDVTRRVHADQTPRSAIGRIKLHMKDRADELLKKRCRIFSVWRPLLPVIEAYPLSAASFTSVAPEDMVPIDVIYPHYAEESFEVRHNPNLRWYYKSAMTNEDIMVIKLYDNKMTDKTAYFAPHASWRDPAARKDAPPRRSIELRVMLFG
ncbi:hypothetical protein TWF694_009371 [Orbilia ellipsospora]|uniref:Uncharacterized protein n=1 Tax=Orbilia ellipsospora TaxID=2528407 RepID=A0AAV9XFZ0_9PEZI